MAMLGELGNRIRQYLSGRTSASPEQEEATAARGRQERADTMARLQDKVRQLQQEITDLGDTSGAAAPRADAERQAALYRELEQRQAELARYQGRI